MLKAPTLRLAYLWWVMALLAASCGTTDGQDTSSNVVESEATTSTLSEDSSTSTAIEEAATSTTAEEVPTSSGGMTLVGTDFTDASGFPESSVCPSLTSPAISWTGVPEGTVTFAVAMYGDEGGTKPLKIWWTLFNIGADVEALDTGSDGGGSLGTNNVFGQETLGYEPPCPNDTEAHQLDITVFALSAALDVSDSRELSYDELLTEMDGLILDSATLASTLRRESVGP